MKIQQPKALRMDYRKLNKKCAYCDAEAEIIRTTQTTTGDLLFSTMCLKHCEGEKKYAIEQGMKLAGQSRIVGAFTDATLVDLSAFDELVGNLSEGSELKTLVDKVVEEREEEVGDGA